MGREQFFAGFTAARKAGSSPLSLWGMGLFVSPAGAFILKNPSLISYLMDHCTFFLFSLQELLDFLPKIQCQAGVVKDKGTPNLASSDLVTEESLMCFNLLYSNWSEYSKHFLFHMDEVHSLSLLSFWFATFWEQVLLDPKANALNGIGFNHLFSMVWFCTLKLLGPGMDYLSVLSRLCMFTHAHPLVHVRSL